MPSDQSLILAEFSAKACKSWLFYSILTALVICLIGLSALQCHRLSAIRKQVAKNAGISIRVKSARVNVDIPEEFQNDGFNGSDLLPQSSPPPYNFSIGGGGESSIVEVKEDRQPS